MVEAIDEVNRTRPESRTVMSRSTSLARCTDVEINDAQLVLEFGVGGECSTRPDAGVQRDCLNSAPAGGRPRIELLDAVGLAEVDLDGLNLRRVAAERSGGEADRVIVGHDEEIKAVGELLGQLVADPA
jgi:hypothetical protein